MERETATVLLNKVVDDKLLEAKVLVEKEIEKAVDEKLAETKQVIMDTVDRILGERILTGREAILAVLEKAAIDSGFMARLSESPEQALQGYGLTSEEKAALSSGDIRRIEKWVGKLTREQSKWLWARLQQERW